MPTSIPLSSILCEDRQRLDLSDTDGLKDSLATHGTIQPLVLEQLTIPSGPHLYRLIAGGRRLHFLQQLGHDTLFHGSVYNPAAPGFVFGSELTADQKQELELEENIRRKAMSWQEEALGIAKIHRLKVVRFGAEGRKWGQKQTGELLGVSAGNINYTLAIAEGLNSSPSHPFWKMDGPLDCIRWMTEQKENFVMKHLAKSQAEASARYLAPDKEDLSVQEDEEKILAKERYLANPLNDPDKFEEYYAEKQSQKQAAPRVFISPRLFHGSCLDWMKQNPASVDHIITDPPYGIDMENLDFGYGDIASVEDTHQVDANLDLLRAFFPLAYTTLKDSGYCIIWADQMLWQFLYDTAMAAGFKVQRWPYVWVKTHPCRNSAAAYNFTKTTEIALICRKGNATLIKPGPLGHVLASHDDYKKMMDHPFVKPFEAWTPLISAVSIQGQTILDAFAGQGSGVLSLLKMNRNYFACELEEHHYNKLMENVKGHYRGLDERTEFV